MVYDEFIVIGHRICVLFMEKSVLTNSPAEEN